MYIIFLIVNFSEEIEFLRYIKILEIEDFINNILIKENRIYKNLLS